MFTLDIPDLPPHYSAVMVAQANQDQFAAAAKERAMGYCEPVAYKPSVEHDVVNGLSPASAAAGYFYLYEKRQIDPESASRIDVLVPPKHGKVVPFKDYPLEHNYIPDPGYIGNDKVVLRVHFGGTTVRVVYLLKVTDVGGEDSADVIWALCKKTGVRWKISLPDPTLDPAATQFLISSVGANATLTNPVFTGGAGWSTAGIVTFTHGAATLTESAVALDDVNAARPHPNPLPEGEGVNGTAFGSGTEPSDASHSDGGCSVIKEGGAMKIIPDPALKRTPLSPCCLVLR